ncbi:MAG: TIGR03936 family radical SAM-associated protein [Anaerolineaceae bacterium]
MNDTPHRIRICFSKNGDLRFIGHLDLQRLFERALRRAGLPLRYSQGFNPKVRLSLASALPLGFSSDCELLDFLLDQALDSDYIQEKLEKSLPADIQVLEVNEVPNQLPSLQASLTACEYRITLPEDADINQVKKNLETLLSQETIPFTRRQKLIDLKPMVESLHWEDQDGENQLFVRMSALPQANGRPDELLLVLGIDPALCRICRTHLYFEQPEDE